ncbi:M-phase inducer phosphatase cdc-25.3-like [Mya arenaria]|uniref:M-phase inducer phosphatase cdc-25.3-like n=1 Tax=Mya arenaria TaxID=6604 RepID=UPI0022DFBBE1|nr:M-phase inducer phosphatase cdc-25.3-like [Mya arenaria]
MRKKLPVDHDLKSEQTALEDIFYKNFNQRRTDVNDLYHDQKRRRTSEVHPKSSQIYDVITNESRSSTAVDELRPCGRWVTGQRAHDLDRQTQGSHGHFARNGLHPELPKRDNVSSEKNHVIVFHCEFSSERGPNMYRHLRSLDRESNKDSNPQLNFPEVYLLEGGYKEFYHQFQLEGSANVRNCSHA